MATTSTSQLNSALLRIDIVSDVVCPWCVIGYRQLYLAMEQTGIEASIHWHPFELNPQMPPEGQNMNAHLAEKYGTTVEESTKARERLSQLGQSLGFTFNFTDNSQMVNTFLAHQMIEWALEWGRQTDMKLALFKAHFTDARDVSDINVLCQVTDELGLVSSESRKMLENGSLATDVRTMQQFWTGKGIQGVPAMIFDLKNLVTGAQGVDTYASLLSRFTAETMAS